MLLMSPWLLQTPDSQNSNCKTDISPFNLNVHTFFSLSLSLTVLMLQIIFTGIPGRRERLDRNSWLINSKFFYFLFFSFFCVFLQKKQGRKGIEFFATNLHFLIFISSQSDGTNLWYFRLRLIDPTKFIVWNIKSLRHLVPKIRG